MDLPLVALLGAAHAALSAEVAASVAEVAPDQRPVHGSIMEQLDFRDGLRLTDLAAGAGITPQSAGELVDQLEAAGYVERRPDPDDRRAKRIHRTDRAKRVSAVALATAQRLDRDLAGVIGEDGVADLRRQLAVVVEHFGGELVAPIDDPS